MPNPNPNPNRNPTLGEYMMLLDNDMKPNPAFLLATLPFFLETGASPDTVHANTSTSVAATDGSVAGSRDVHMQEPLFAGSASDPAHLKTSSTNSTGLNRPRRRSSGALRDSLLAGFGVQDTRGSLWDALPLDEVCFIVEGGGSRVEGRGSRVTGGGNEA